MMYTAHIIDDCVDFLHLFVNKKFPENFSQAGLRFWLVDNLAAHDVVLLGNADGQFITHNGEFMYINRKKNAIGVVLDLNPEAVDDYVVEQLKHNKEYEIYVSATTPVNRNEGGASSDIHSES